MKTIKKLPGAKSAGDLNHLFKLASLHFRVAFPDNDPL